MWHSRLQIDPLGMHSSLKQGMAGRRVSPCRGEKCENLTSDLSRLGQVRSPCWRPRGPLTSRLET